MGFSDALAFAVVMTLRDMNKEKEKRLIKTQKYYQECYERIAEDSKQVFDIVSNVIQKAAGRYIPVEIGTGSTYLSLYAFSQVIEKQGQVTKEQSKLIKIYFDNFDYILGDYAYGKVRLKGFNEKSNKNFKPINDYSKIDEYIKNNCAYDCRYFIIKRVVEKD